MKIRTALTLRYTCITAAVFLVFITAIYYVSEHSRSNAFFRNLKSEAITKAHLFLNNQVDAETMQSIYLNNKKFIDEVEVARLRHRLPDVIPRRLTKRHHKGNSENDRAHPPKERNRLLHRGLPRSRHHLYFRRQGLHRYRRCLRRLRICQAGNPERDTCPITVQRTDRADYCRLPPCPERIDTHQKHRERSGEHNRLTNQQTPACQE